MRAQTKLREKTDKPWNLDEIGQFLGQQGIRPSFHRLKIFEYLINERTHPTADEIYEVLKKEIPAISRATVYNTLRLFFDRKIVQVLNIEKNEARYDATLTWHGHFKCLLCGQVYDVEIESLELSGLDNYQVLEKHLDLKGLCPSCSHKK
ncbi:MAG: transcriptional repressor [Acidobacteriota bacterium]|nr:transcriptional repressor [Acidobacteriota bacterium]